MWLNLVLNSRWYMSLGHSCQVVAFVLFGVSPKKRACMGVNISQVSSPEDNPVYYPSNNLLRLTYAPPLEARSVTRLNDSTLVSSEPARLSQPDNRTSLR